MYLRQLFRILFRTLNHQYDYTFDWTLLKQKAAASTSSSTLFHGPGTQQGITSGQPIPGVTHPAPIQVQGMSSLW